MDKILVVAAHSDDEVLGCGGTISALAERGHHVTVIFLTNGVGARNVELDDPKVLQRLAASHAACNVMGVSRIEQLNFPDNRMDTVPLLDVVQAIEPIIAETEPSIILTHYAYDLNVDHRICHQAVLTACRPQPGHFVKKILSFEVVSSTEWAFSKHSFEPNYYFDITDSLDQKLSAIEAYNDEIRASPHPRSRAGIKALARWRGATVGCEAAEAFAVVRMITKDI